MFFYESRPNVTSDAAGALPEERATRSFCAAERNRCNPISRSPKRSPGIDCRGHRSAAVQMIESTDRALGRNCSSSIDLSIW